MKRLAAVITAIVLITIIIPYAVVEISNLSDAVPRSDGSLNGETRTIKVYLAQSGSVVEMNAEDYVKGAVAGEMPSSFEEEALKAQAVACRSYLLNKIESGTADDAHKGAVICTDSTHCQAYNADISDESFYKISRAVEATASEVITYNGKTADAVFFSTSSGNTENASDVWGNEVPYLVSVPSPGEEDAPNFKSETVISEDELKSRFEEKIDGTDWSAGIIENIRRSEAGGIITASIGGVPTEGRAIREILGLRSSNIQITRSGEDFVFEVTGNGHGVGMSQYGANAMAKNGSGYKEILEHYYTGVSLEKSEYFKTDLDKSEKL